MVAITNQTLLGGLALLIIGGGLGYYLWYMPAQTPTHVNVGGTIIEVETLTTPAQLQKGLSGRASLPLGSGMLFVFDHDDLWGIWMKDMRFSIDIIWADKDGTVVHVEKEVSPETYPRVFLPPAFSRYVLEVPAGFADDEGIAISDAFVVQ